MKKGIQIIPNFVIFRFYCFVVIVYHNVCSVETPTNKKTALSFNLAIFTKGFYETNKLKIVTSSNLQRTFARLPNLARNKRKKMYFLNSHCKDTRKFL